MAPGSLEFKFEQAKGNATWWGFQQSQDDEDRGEVVAEKKQVRLLINNNIANDLSSEWSSLCETTLFLSKKSLMCFTGFVIRRARSILLSVISRASHSSSQSSHYSNNEEGHLNFDTQQVRWLNLTQRG
jgi:hypothetical protein